MSQETTKIEKLEVAPPLRLVGMTWVSMIIIYFLPSAVWAIVLKVIIGIFIFSVIRGSFFPIWKRYETMGAFVTMQAVWFAGLLWIPESLSFLRYVFVFLIILGFATKFKQIKHINQGKGPDLNPNL
jgi:hypothetical protein